MNLTTRLALISLAAFSLTACDDDDKCGKGKDRKHGCKQKCEAAQAGASQDDDRYEFILVNENNQVLLDKQTGRLWNYGINETSRPTKHTEITPDALKEQESASNPAEPPAE